MLTTYSDTSSFICLKKKKMRLTVEAQGELALNNKFPACILSLSRRRKLSSDHIDIDINIMPPPRDIMLYIL